MLRSLVGFRMDELGNITDKVENGLYDRMRRRNGISLSDTYNDNFNCDERDNDELHASAGRLGEWVSFSRKVLQGRILTSWRSCRSTDCTSAA